MSDDPYAERKQLTFAQAEGVDPLPTQLKLKEVSEQLRAVLWGIVHRSMEKNTEYHSVTGESWFKGAWEAILYRKHVFRDHRMADEFVNLRKELTEEIKAIFVMGDYIAVFDFLQWLLRLRTGVVDPKVVAAALEGCRAAYRLLDDGETIVPISVPEELGTLNRAFAELAGSEFGGARTHLRRSAEHLISGTPADSIRESMHAVESVARVLGGTDSLRGALQRLKSTHGLHPALERGFGNIYGFTSDEKGIRHPLLDDGTAKVDEADATFMLGACAAFVSYMINRTRQV